MKRILLDTNTYVAFKNGQKAAIEVIRLSEQIAVCTIVLGELLAGFINGSQEAKNRKELSDFLNSPRVTQPTPDNETAEFYARIYLQLKKKGQPIPTNDLWIAAIALQHGYAIFTYDKHFTAIDNLISCCAPEELLP